MPLDEQERQWRQYALLTEVTKHALELLVKANIFYYAVTGAILSFFVSRTDPTRLSLRLLLVLPLIMGLCFLAICVLHACTVWKPRQEVERFARALGYATWLDPGTLGYWLWASVVFYGLTVVGLALLIFRPTMIVRWGY